MAKLTVIGFLAAGAVALTATVAANQSRGAGGAVQDVRALAVPASRVFEIDGTPVRLDTRTGAMYSLRGDAGARGTSAHWWLNVPALSDQTSGMLDIQRTRDTGMDGIFLVDVREGTTWLLRWRGNKNGAWFRVPDAR